MIEKVGFEQNIFHSSQKNKNINVPSSLNVSKTGHCVVKMSLENLHANFLSFTGNKSVFGVPINSAKDIDEALGIVNVSDTSWRINLTRMPKAMMLDYPYYAELADNIAIGLGPDKSVLLRADADTRQELLTHRFAKDVADGKYIAHGMDPKKTEVVYIDSNKAKEANVDIAEVLQKAYYKNRNSSKKTVIFVSDLEKLFVALKSKSGYYKNFIEDKFLGTSVKLVGFLDNEKYIAAIEKPGTKIKSLTTLDFKSLGTEDTKNFLRREPDVLAEVTNRYGKYITVSEAAIDSIVDRCATQIEGAFPNKALDVLDLVISTRLNDSGFASDSTTVIDERDVANFFVNHEALVKYLKPKKGNFGFAENVTTKLSDVGGLSEIKKDIYDDVIAFAKDPKEFIAKGGKYPRGVLLEGPPGNGKTLLARAVAGEAGVPFSAISGSGFVEVYVGVGAKRVREWFEQLRDAAANSGKNVAIGFIDEIDAIGGKRTGGDGGAQERESTLNQILTEMDGFNKESKIKVIILGATNRKDLLDSALLRRFDSSYEVPNPETIADRLEILKIHTRKEKFASEEEKEKILDEIAKITEGMSGDELSKTVENASKVVAKRVDNKVITHNDMVEGFLRVLAGPIRKTDMPVEQKSLIVRHEGGHAVALDTLKGDKISFITLDGRGSFLGAVFHNSNKKLSNFKSAIFSAAVSYAGGIAEPDYDSLGHSEGVTGDVRNATSVIEHAIKDCGLGIHTPPIKIGKDSDNLTMYSQEIKKDINMFTAAAQKIAKKIVTFHREFLDDYVKQYEANAGKGGNNLSGAEFTKMREKWLLGSKKTKDFEKLQREIDRIVEIAQNSNKGFFERLVKRVMMRLR